MVALLQCLLDQAQARQESVRAVAAKIEAGEGGSIINIGSNSWWEAAGGMPIDTTAKAAVHGLTRLFARDLGQHRIRANLVVPGWVMTERQTALWATPAALARHRAAVPAGSDRARPRRPHGRRTP